jgi:adenylate cyclase
MLVTLALLPVVRMERRLWGIVVYLAPAMLAPLVLATLGRMLSVMLPVAAPTASLAVFAAGVLLMRAEQERRKALQLEQHLLSFLPAPLAHDIARQLPAGETLGKPCQGILLAVRVQGLERWTSSVDSLQALAVAHAISTTADCVASSHGGVVEHVRGEVLVLAWHEASAQGVDAALQAARRLLAELPALLQPNSTLAYPLGACACLEAGSYLLGVAGPKSLRRAMLLGPASDQIMAMLPFCEELATPLLMGPVVAGMAMGQKLHSLGHFLLPDHPQARQLFRAEL